MRNLSSSVLFIMHMPPPVHGASMMGKYIHDSETVNGAFDCHYINLATAKDLIDIGKIGVKKLVQFIKLLRNIHKEVKRWRPQLVYVTPNAFGGAFYKDFVVVEMLKSMGCKVVVHYHNKGVSTRQDRWLDNLLYRKFFKNIKVILLSKRLYSDMKKYVRLEDVYFCPNGAPDVERSIVEKTNRITHLLFLSNLIEEKGVIVLLDALKMLKERGLSFVCDFVGGETVEIDKERFNREVAQRGLNGMVLYHGKKYGEEKEAFLNEADIFVFPTYYHNECFPVVLLEAMEHALPCISTNEGGIADIIDDGETGFIVERKDVIALSDKLELLIKDAEMRREMGKNGLLKYKKAFTLDVFERNIVNVLDKIMNSNHSVN